MCLNFKYWYDEGDRRIFVSLDTVHINDEIWAFENEVSIKKWSICSMPYIDYIYQNEKHPEWVREEL